MEPLKPGEKERERERESHGRIGRISIALRHEEDYGGCDLLQARSLAHQDQWLPNRTSAPKILRCNVYEPIPLLYRYRFIGVDMWICVKGDGHTVGAGKRKRRVFNKKN
ncbi:hypothetical protein U1Q18_009414 [Sarracenia purpurea var. burkii]